jgi:TPR repeat protein
MAARRGDPEGQYRFALMYQQGKGVDRDDAQAVRWFRMAAKQQHAEAQYQLAVHMEHGRGVQADEKEMAAWYQLAAQKKVQAFSNMK